MFIFALFIQKIDFKQSQFQKVGVAPAEYLFQLSLLEVVGESSFKSTKVLLDE